MNRTLIAQFASGDSEQALFQIAEAAIDVIADVPGSDLPTLDKSQAASIGIIAALLEINHTLLEIRNAVRNIDPCRHEPE